MFFYLLHLYVLKGLYLAALARGADPRHLYALDSVSGLLLVACALAVVLYPPTRAFARFKARRRDLPWLRYL
jgi:predicted PurR-regulated permease PerM